MLICDCKLLQHLESILVECPDTKTNESIQRKMSQRANENSKKKQANRMKCWENVSGQALNFETLTLECIFSILLSIYALRC